MPDAFFRDAGGPDGGNDASCEPVVGGVEPALSVLDLDGGIPLDEFGSSQALAWCSYVSRCGQPMAPYLIAQCAADLANGGWGFESCDGGPCIARTQIGGGPFGRPPYDAIDAGAVVYESQQAAACFQALETMPCVDSSGDPLFWPLPACAWVFSVPGPDGGMPEPCQPGYCPSAFSPSNLVKPCATNADCAGEPDGGGLVGPYCFGGYCLASPCGGYNNWDPSWKCPGFVDAGEPCRWDPPSPGQFANGLESVCAPGLVCRGAPPDGGYGVCSTPSDVGQPCVEGALTTGCLIGLSCECGVCEIPPAAGPCAYGGLCQAGVAYCDGNDTCQPDLEAGEQCPVVMDCQPGNPESSCGQCAPNLRCDNGICIPWTDE